MQIFTKNNNFLGDVTRGVFSRTFNYKKHVLHSKNAICFGMPLLERLQAENVREIRYTDDKDGTAYSIRLSMVYACGESLSQGYPQIAVPIHYWETTNPKKATNPSGQQSIDNQLQLAF